MATTDIRLPRSSTSAPSPSPKPLSCTSCRQRKVKCNKTYPCQPCTKSGVECVFPQRLRVPRGKQRASKARDSELLERIGRLESLVSKADAVKALFQHQSRANGDGDGDVTLQETEVVNRALESTKNSEVFDDGEHQEGGKLTEGFAAFIREQECGNRYISKDFWNTLGDEVEGLRGLLEQQGEVDDAADNDDKASSPIAAQSVNSPDFIFSACSTNGSRIYFKQPNYAQRSTLMQIYMRNVHPCFPVLHEPIIRLHLLRTTELLDESHAHYKFPSLDALSFAIYFAAVSSIPPEECMDVLGEEKNLLLARYKSATEMALGTADFLNSMELVTLTAFVVYLVAARSSNNTRSMWALVGLVVRIAQSLNLHRDGDGTQFTTFEAEMRRRLWWGVVVLDMRASEDRGSEPVIADGSFNTPMPHNLNDEDFGPHTQGELPNRRQWTLMGYFLMSADVSITIRKLNFVPLFDTVPALTIKQKEQMIKDCTLRMETHYSSGINTSGPRPELSSILGRILSLRLWSLLQYPLQKQRREAHVVWPEGDALRTAVNMLELVDMSIGHPDGQRYKWYWDTWVPWHPVSMALAELCKNPHGKLAESAWPAVEKGYKLCSLRVADSSEGMLWKPVKKLYRKAQRLRFSASQSPGSTLQDTLTATNSPEAANNTYRQPLRVSIDSLCDTHTSSMQQSIPSMMGSDTQLYTQQYSPFSNSNMPVSAALPTYSPILHTNNYLSPSGLDWMPHGVDVTMRDDFGGQLNWDVWHDFMFDNSEVAQNTSNIYGTSLNVSNQGTGAGIFNNGWIVQ